MVCPACRYNSQQSCFRRCTCPCDGYAVGRLWYTPDRAELDTYESPETPYDDQGDMEEQTEDMDDEWEVYHQLLQDQDNFDPAAGEDGTAEPTKRGRACARVYRPGNRVGSAGAGRETTDTG